MMRPAHYYIIQLYNTYYTIIFFCYYAIVVALFYIHYYKPMRIAFKNILTTLLIISVH